MHGLIPCRERSAELLRSYLDRAGRRAPAHARRACSRTSPTRPAAWWQPVFRRIARDCGTGRRRRSPSRGSPNPPLHRSASRRRALSHPEDDRQGARSCRAPRSMPTCEPLGGVAALIQRRRLERIRAILADPRDHRLDLSRSPISTASSATRISAARSAAPSAAARATRAKPPHGQPNRTAANRLAALTGILDSPAHWQVLDGRPARSSC